MACFKPRVPLPPYQTGPQAHPASFPMGFEGPLPGWSAMKKSCFVVGLCCVSRVFGLTESLSANLQRHNFDLAQCIQHVDRVFNEAKAMRNDAVSGFSSLSVKAQEMATFISCEIRAPSQCGRQVNRDSYGASDPQTYCRLSTYTQCGPKVPGLRQ